jgi:hypothetical protein
MTEVVHGYIGGCDADAADFHLLGPLSTTTVSSSWCMGALMIGYIGPD